MITLITGVPGSGKTLSVVSDLAKKVKKEWVGRKIFTHGIPDLVIPTEKIPEGHTINDMNVWLQYPENNGSVVIIDEAQNIFPPRSSGSKTPELVEWLHVHRHSGVDIILITQMPGRIDKQVRDLVGAHYHIHKTPLGVRMRYFWDYCENSPKSGMKNARPEVYKFDKKAFGLYKSAEIHTKVKTPKSRVLWVIPVALIVFGFTAYMGYSLLSGLGSSEKADSENSSVSSVVGVSSDDLKKSVKDKSAMAGQEIGGQIAPSQNKNLTEEMLKPKIDGLVESKPLYDSIRQVKQLEYPVACISGGKSGCSCYSSQGTIIKEIDKKTCNDYAKNGMPFNPYKENSRDVVQNSNVHPINDDSGQVVSLGGKSPQNLMYDGYAEAGQQFAARVGVVGSSN
ncbi:zonula occludens toxin (Zot) [Neisseria sicca ATCC 29256]|uniref:Zonula occludens toxin (Zot) n=1 Tax=Neisseria sicca ATCC 29256 TaxID=547045 RepID=C6MAH0_NEISI|nr:zonular occludens toxin domain-containing protein [Neisseria sicca]EET42688.1 zonula occludens toxin (Zot) [Neisseria sicca ATCC 29256]QMT38791.1 AAA family ATPase [Neisseria sicca]QMT38804.1 AAA family ATPase [Neisseria sicca]